MAKMVILDRDGVVNHLPDDDITTVDGWDPIPGSIEAINRLKKQVTWLPTHPTIQAFRAVFIAKKNCWKHTQRCNACLKIEAPVSTKFSIARMGPKRIVFVVSLNRDYCFRLPVSSILISGKQQS